MKKSDKIERSKAREIAAKLLDGGSWALYNGMRTFGQTSMGSHSHYLWSPCGVPPVGGLEGYIELRNTGESLPGNAEVFEIHIGGKLYRAAMKGSVSDAEQQQAWIVFCQKGSTTLNQDNLSYQKHMLRG